VSFLQLGSISSAVQSAGAAISAGALPQKTTSSSSGVPATQAHLRCKSIYDEGVFQASRCKAAGSDPNDQHCQLAQSFARDYEACLKATPLEQAAYDVRRMPLWKWAVGGLALAVGVVVVVKIAGRA
jgi:hypothetical protein